MPRGHALIIDDSSTARIILARLLERADITTKGVVTAEEAFEVLQNESFDIIFLDHLLPGMNGFQALERLKKQHNTQNIPVFMYTSQNAERYRQEARALGAAGVVGKQVNRDELVRTLDAILTGTQETTTIEEATRFPSQPPLESDIPTAGERGLSGRLSTLEVAYEEVDDEISRLRQALLDQQKQHQSELDRLRLGLRFFACLAVIGIGLLSAVYFLQQGDISQIRTQLDDQFSLLQRIIGGVIELMQREP